MKGILGKKLGMSQVFDPDTGAVTAVTVIEAGPCPVGQVKTSDGAVGETLTVESFEPGEAIKVSGVSIGKGYQGTIKRHGFTRGPVSHGSHNLRQPGSIGASAFPSRVVTGGK